MHLEESTVAEKLTRWEKYLRDYRLPDWESIPDLGLYMEQVLLLLEKYLDYFPPELKAEQFITAATINNYVRKKVIPEPVKKRYYRPHIAYLLMICSLKQSLSIALLQELIPIGLSEEELRQRYTAYVKRQHMATGYFVGQVEAAAGLFLKRDEISELATKDPEEFIMTTAIVSGFARLLAEKLILLDEEGRVRNKKETRPEI